MLTKPVEADDPRNLPSFLDLETARHEPDDATLTAYALRIDDTQSGSSGP